MREYYYLKGQRVKLIIPPSYKKGIIRNCMIELENGKKVIRPFRGLRINPKIDLKGDE